MFMSANQVIDLGIYISYCIIHHQILTELIFGAYNVRQTETTADSSSQGLAGGR
jgi:hypothetical protein